MRYCITCKITYPAGSNFCGICGGSLISRSSTQVGAEEEEIANELEQKNGPTFVSRPSHPGLPSQGWPPIYPPDSLSPTVSSQYSPQMQPYPTNAPTVSNGGFPQTPAYFVAGAYNLPQTPYPAPTVSSNNIIPPPPPDKPILAEEDDEVRIMGLPLPFVPQQQIPFVPDMPRPGGAPMFQGAPQIGEPPVQGFQPAHPSLGVHPGLQPPAAGYQPA